MALNDNRPVIGDMSRLLMQADSFAFLEKRLENDVSGNPLYVGYNKTPNCGTAVESWFIIKLSYDAGTFVDHVQLPAEGPKFGYAWDDRASIF